jgi:hypothetical protein
MHARGGSVTVKVKMLARERTSAKNENGNEIE